MTSGTLILLLLGLVVTCQAAPQGVTMKVMCPSGWSIHVGKVFNNVHATQKVGHYLASGCCPNGYMLKVFKHNYPGPVCCPGTAKMSSSGLRVYCNKSMDKVVPPKMGTMTVVASH